MGNLKAARLALEGLSIGDGFGDRFFDMNHAEQIVHRVPPDAPWPYTDDTNMALSVYEILRLHGIVQPEALALSFGVHYDPRRKYGSAMHNLLRVYAEGASWTMAQKLFEGQGSYGNGAAMRIAPLGAYFAEDLAQVTEQARVSAIVTHAHPEGIAGAVAVAIAAAYATRLRGSSAPTRSEFLQMILPHVPYSEVKSRITRAAALQTNHAAHVAAMLGNGSMISAQDTVPYALWCAASHLDNFEEALWVTVSGFGDIDTNCAIVGGIVASYVGEAALPQVWISRREALPDWAIGSDV
jgi:ADP-ribosylglycohydrolase